MLIHLLRLFVVNFSMKRRFAPLISHCTSIYITVFLSLCVFCFYYDWLYYKKEINMFAYTIYEKCVVRFSFLFFRFVFFFLTCSCQNDCFLWALSLRTYASKCVLFFLVLNWTIKIKWWKTLCLKTLPPRNAFISAFVEPQSP